MKKFKSMLFVVVIIAIILYLFINVFKSNYAVPFTDIVRKYDDIYSERLKEFENENVIRCYKLDENIGFIVYGQGYEDDILLFTELSEKNTEKIEVLYHNETVGYGDLVVEDWFLNRLYIPYENKLITVRNRKDNAYEVIAITGATLTSDAVVNAINECAQIMGEIKDE